MLTEREILTKTEAMQLNPVALAFVGDTVYSLYVRERLALSGCRQKKSRNNLNQSLASLFEGGGTARAVTEGVSFLKWYTPPVSFADSPLWEGAEASVRR